MKVAIIYAFKESSWFSCTKITSNLIKTYQKIYDDSEVKYFDYDFDRKNFNLEDFGDSIFNYKPDKIVFLDHKPHPDTIIEYLVDKKYLKTKPPEIIFHIFGCFTINLYSWKSLEKYLKGCSVKFFCASDRQVKLLKKLLNVKGIFIEKVPFPVDATEFQYVDERESLGKRLFSGLSPNSKESLDEVVDYLSKAQRPLRGLKLKKKLGLSKKSKIIFYSGRFSLQKRLIELVEIFSQAHLNRDLTEDTYLLLAGKFDSTAFRFGGIFHLEGEYFRNYDKAIKDIPAEILEKVIFLGNIPNKDLKEYYSAADLFVSLSTYHDEDYGMSVAEAGMCGTPLLLTNWAGFFSFKKNNLCQLISTKINEHGPEFDKNEAYHKMVNMLDGVCKDASLRKETAMIFDKEHSIEGVSKVLKAYLEKPCPAFSGFNDFMHELSYAENTYYHPFYDQMNKKLNENYLELYEAYVRSN